MDGIHNLNYHGYTLEIHHGGSFKEEVGELLYSGGEISRWDIDPNKVSITHMVKELEKMGYKVAEGGAEATEGGAVGRKGVDAVVVAEEIEGNSSGSESDFAYADVPVDLSEEDDHELQDIRSQVEIAKKKRAAKLKSLRLQKDLDVVIREARHDKPDKKGKEKEGAIAAVEKGDEGYITDYPSSNEACSINSGDSTSEFGDDEDTVRKMFDNHTCNISYKNSRVNSQWLARHYMGTIRSLPSIKLYEFKKLVKEQLGVEVSRSQCRRAKENVYNLLVGDSKAEYALMWFYADELKRANRDSSVYMMVQRPISTESPIFDRLYVCFDTLKTGFVKGCRQIIGIDGCFLKTVVKGELLIAIGRDGNIKCFPLLGP
ncbi:hypothetical protein CRG98_019233 [Punica granatum]|uniref:PB1-like domain-containing protein n=1 Tax=Punica granatum TaxID=22663 RepID=A0A2I0JWY5_PUNGR|nr:hypothetical protein CRG98_019233 [Punica granatum]